MSKKQVAILWGFQIVLYITIIVLTIITGGTLATCILGWVLASILAGLIIYLCFRLIDKQKAIDEINKKWLKSIKDWKKLVEKERQIHAKTGENNSNNKV